MSDHDYPLDKADIERKHLWRNAIEKYKQETGNELKVPEDWAEVGSLWDAIRLIHDGRLDGTLWDDSEEWDNVDLKVSLMTILEFLMGDNGVSATVQKMLHEDESPAAILVSSIAWIKGLANAVEEKRIVVKETLELAAKLLAPVRIKDMDDVGDEFIDVVVALLVQFLALLRITAKNICDAGVSLKGSEPYTAITTEFLNRVEEALKTMRELTYDEDVRKEQHRIYWFFCAGNPPPDYATVCQSAYEVAEDWFTTSSTYKEWCDFPGKVMWVHGRIGTGKTCLLPRVWKDLYSRHRIAYSETHNKYLPRGKSGGSTVCCWDADATYILRSLLVQLAYDLPTIPEALKLCEQKVKAGCLTFNDIVSALKELVSLFSRCYLIIDALDRCNEVTRHQLLRALSDTSECSSSLNILLVSQPDISVLAYFPLALIYDLNMPPAEPYVSLDVRGMVDRALYKVPTGDHDSDVLQLIITELCQRSGGMFLLATCQLHILQRHSIEDMATVLAELPRDLYGIYSYIWRSIPREYLPQIRCILQWLLFSRCILSSDVLEEATCTVDTDMDRSDSSACGDIIYATALYTITSGLITQIDYSRSPGQEVLFIHPSVKAYLLEASESSTFHFDPIDCHRDMTRECLSCLASNTEDREDFATYARIYWKTHLILGSRLDASTLDFEKLETEHHISLAWSPEAFRAWIARTVPDEARAQDRTRELFSANQDIFQFIASQSKDRQALTAADYGWLALEPPEASVSAGNASLTDEQSGNDTLVLTAPGVDEEVDEETERGVEDEDGSKMRVLTAAISYLRRVRECMSDDEWKVLFVTVAVAMLGILLGYIHGVVKGRAT